VTVPTGFSVLVSNPGYGPNGQQALVAWKRASGSDTGTYSFTGPSDADWACQAFCFDGRDPISPPVASTAAVHATYQASPTVFTANALTTVAGDDLLFLGCPDMGNTIPSTMTVPPTGFTVTENTAFGITSLGSANEDNAAGGSVTASATFDCGAGVQGWLAWLVRLPKSTIVTYTDAASGGSVSSGSLVDELIHSHAGSGGAVSSGFLEEGHLYTDSPVAHATSGGSLVELYRDGSIPSRLSLLALDTSLLAVSGSDVHLLALSASDA
jgi:hypothetical protein